MVMNDMPPCPKEGEVEATFYVPGGAPTAWASLHVRLCTLCVIGGTPLPSHLESNILAPYVFLNPISVQPPFRMPQDPRGERNFVEFRRSCTSFHYPPDSGCVKSKLRSQVSITLWHFSGRLGVNSTAEMMYNRVRDTMLLDSQIRSAA